MDLELIIVLSIIVFVVVFIFILARRQTSEMTAALRPFSAHKALKGQVSQSN
jgi:preprotein translocase subunit YajC